MVEFSKGLALNLLSARDECYQLEAENAQLKEDKARLRHALEHCKDKLGITDTFCPLGPALDCAPIIRDALFRTKDVAADLRKGE